MKATYLLPLLASAITTALSHPHHHPASDSPFVPTLTSRAESVPYACSKASDIIQSQLAELSRLQAKAIPIPDDLGGFFYAIVLGRRMLGCPSTSLISAHSKRDVAGSGSIIQGRAERSGDPCVVLRVLYDQVVDPIRVLKENGIPVPAYLSGFWGSVKDGVDGLQCSFSVDTTTSGNYSTGSTAIS